MADYKSIMSYAEKYNMPLDTSLNVDWWQKLADKAYEKGVKSFAKFLIDKGIDGFEMPDLVAEFLEKER